MAKIKRFFKPEKREYTLMFVPHQGTTVFKVVVPVRSIKIGATVLVLTAVIAMSTYFSTYKNYHEVVTVAQNEKQELEQLRAVNQQQAVHLQQLAKETASLQADMTKLNQLDSELRRLVNSDELAPVSRAGTVRPPAGQYSGQGGLAAGSEPKLQELENLVGDLRATAQERMQSLIALRESLLQKKAKLAARPSIWPAEGEVTSRFGWRSAPMGGGGGDWHPGIDIAGAYGTPIYAAADGYVTQSSWNDGGYGNMVEIEHGNGTVTIYGHNAQNVAVAGSLVKKGDLIAYMGSTGYSTGTHVHYEVRVNGSAVNPENFLR